MTELYDVHHGDCIPHMLGTMEPESVDFSVFSPPFPSLYAYTDSESDIGNVDSMGSEAQVHLSFMFRGLARVLKPGRAAVVHVCQIPRMKRSGGVGLCDFRGMNIRLGERAGLTAKVRRLRPSGHAAGSCNSRGLSLTERRNAARFRII